MKNFVLRRCRLLNVDRWKKIRVASSIVLLSFVSLCEDLGSRCHPHCFINLSFTLDCCLKVGESFSSDLEHLLERVSTALLGRIMYLIELVARVVLDVSCVRRAAAGPTAPKRTWRQGGEVRYAILTLCALAQGLCDTPSHTTQSQKNNCPGAPPCAVDPNQ